jgi:hypothetical protein
MGHFVDLTLSWYGGESAMLEHVGEENTISFRYGQDQASALTEKSQPCWNTGVGSHIQVQLIDMQRKMSHVGEPGGWGNISSRFS